VAAGFPEWPQVFRSGRRFSPCGKELCRLKTCTHVRQVAAGFPEWPQVFNLRERTVQVENLHPLSTCGKTIVQVANLHPLSTCGKTIVQVKNLHPRSTCGKESCRLQTCTHVRHLRKKVVRVENRPPLARYLLMRKWQMSPSRIT